MNDLLGILELKDKVDGFKNGVELTMVPPDFDKSIRIIKGVGISVVVLLVLNLFKK